MRPLAGAALALALTLAGAEASAQSGAAAPVSAARQQEARGLFQQGLDAADAERWAEAVLFFQRSDAIVSRASTRLNLGNALVRMGRVREARDVLRGVLAEPDAARDADRVARARAMLAEAERAVATLRVSLSGAASGAELTVDGDARVERPDAQGSVELAVDPGRHVVAARGTNGAQGEARVTALPGSRSEVQIELRAPAAGPAVVRVMGAPAAATLWIDGAERGPASAPVEASPGEHEVDVRAGSRSLQRQRVRLTAGETLQVLVTESAPPVAPPRRGLTSSPAFWAVAGVLVVGAGAGVVAAVFASQPADYLGSTGMSISPDRQPR